MKMIQTIITFTCALLVSGCYWGISGRVIDAESQQPIDDAVVLAQWTKTHGFGEYYHTVYKIEETETDKNGKFSIAGVYSPFVDKPMLVIYKRGYIAWRNDLVFPSFSKRKDYEIWQDNYEYRLDKFKKGFSRDQHHLFLEHGIIGSDYNKTPRYSDAASYELRESLKEQQR